MAKTLRFLTPLWEVAQLNVVPLTELPRLLNATLWIPGPPVDAKVVLHLFVFDFGMDEPETIRERERRQDQLYAVLFQPEI